MLYPASPHINMKIDKDNPTIKYVQCNLGNTHKIQCIGEFQEPYDCKGICQKPQEEIFLDDKLEDLKEEPKQEPEDKLW